MVVVWLTASRHRSAGSLPAQRRAAPPNQRADQDERRAHDVLDAAQIEVLDARRVVTVAAWTYFPVIRGFRRARFRK
jgi:hypothetical protein